MIKAGQMARAASSGPCLLALAATVSMLAGCGGGSGGTSEPPPLPQAKANVAGLRCTGADGSGWCWQAPQPHGHWVNDVVFTSASNGWAVGDGGLLLHTRDGGASWDERFIANASALKSVVFAPDGRQGWVLGADGGRLWRTVDGGDSWSEAPALPLYWGVQIERAANGALVLTGDAERLGWGADRRVSDDGGATWRDPGSGLLWIDADGTQWHFLTLSEPTYKSVIRKSTDGGKTLEHPAGWPLDSSVGSWGKALGGYAWVGFWPDTGSSDDYTSRVRLGDGQPWVTPDLPSPKAPDWVDALGRWSHGAQLWHANGASEPWTTVTPPYADYNSSGYFFVDGRTAWTPAPGDVPAAWVTADGGASWVRSAFAAGGGNHVPIELRRDGGAGLLMKGGGSISQDPYGAPSAWFRSTDQGRNWTALPGARHPGRPVIEALAVVSAQRLLALASDGQLLQTDDAGRQWQLKAAGLPADAWPPATSLQFTPDGTGWALKAGQLSRSTDGGRTWSPQALPVGPYQVKSLQFIDNRTAFLHQGSSCVITPHHSYPCNYSVYRSDDAGQTWAEVAAAPTAGLLFMLDGTRGISAGAGWVQRSVDGGSNWQAATLPDGAMAGEPRRIVRSGDALWLLSTFGLLRSNDGGATWARVDLALPQGFEPDWRGIGPGLNDITFADASRGWIVGDAGLVMATVDGGRSWQRQTTGTVTRLTRVLAAGPKGVWIGGADNTILASATAGR